MSIGTIIENRRKELGLTLEEVGNAVGVSKSTVKKWETGYISNMRRDRINALAKILQLNPNVLIDETDHMESFYNMSNDNDSICECGYTPSKHSAQFTHEEYHQRYEKAVKKFGVYYPQAERDKIIKEMTGILATNPDLKTQIECQTEILKCCFSESLQHNNFDLRHCKFNDYVAMVLNQNISAIPMSDECIYEMAEIYNRLPGMSEGIIYDIPPETREERRLRNIMKTLQTLNENGQLKVHDFVNYLADSGKYNKPDTDDDEIE